MPVHNPPDPISAYEGREEALKTTWVNSNYPSVPSPLPAMGAPFFSSAKVDPNGAIGLNPDGTWELSKLYGWSSWKAPFIEYIHVHQFAVDGQVRIAWKASHGDLFRTAWIIKVNTVGNFPTSKGTSGTMVNYGGEFNPNEDDKLRWSFFPGRNDRDIQVANAGNWWDIDVFGGYAEDSSPPNPNQLTNPKSAVVNPSAIFSCVLNANPGDEIAVSIIPVDGRQYHTLPLTDNPSGYDVTNNPNSGTDYENYSEGRLKKATYDKSYQLFDAKLSNGVVKIINGMGGLSSEDISNTQAILVPTNVYPFYLRGLQIYHWIYVIESDNPDIGHPYYPDNAPTGHYYDTSSTDDFTTFGLGRWVRYEGSKMFVDGLSAGVEYKVFSCMYYESDLNRYYIDTTLSFTAPAQARPLVQHIFQTTATALAAINQASFILVTPVFEPDYNLQWDYADPNGNINYEFQFRVLNSDGSTSQNWDSPVNVSNKQNWGTNTNPKSATVQANLLLNPGQTIEWKMRAVSSVQEPSPWTGPVTHTS